MTTAHVFIATSLDGFIARTDGDIDWLLQRDDPSEDHGHDAFMADIDMVVMGRGCFEKVLSFQPWPYRVPVLVLSRQLAGTPVPAGLAREVTFSSATPVDLMADLQQRGVRRICVDGGQLVQSFLREGLITDLVVTTAPVLLGNGRPLFGSLPADVDLALVSHRGFPSGLVQSTYRVRT